MCSMKGGEMRNRSVVHLLFGVVVLSTALAVTEVISGSGAFLLVILMALVLIAVQQEKARCEKRILVDKVRVELLRCLSKQLYVERLRGLSKKLHLEYLRSRSKRECAKQN